MGSGGGGVGGGPRLFRNGEVVATRVFAKHDSITLMTFKLLHNMVDKTLMFDLKLTNVRPKS